MRRIQASGLAVLVALSCAVPAALARNSSLYSGPGPRPGPAILYRAPVVAPQLTNAGVWHAPSILVSGATSYRNHEFLYQDFLFDDHGAQGAPDPNNPMDANQGDLFSKAAGTYTYPTARAYHGNAADLVEFRVRPLSHATAFRVTLNTLADPRLIAFSVAIGGSPRKTFPFPDGANVVAPAKLFLTVHPHGRALVADLVHAGTNTPLAGPAPRVRVDRRRNQIEVDVPHREWNPGLGTVRLAMGVGLWEASSGRYLVPGVSADATHPGGAGPSPNPAAFFNVAFRMAEPMPSVTDGVATFTNAAWWRDRLQADALAAGDISRFFVNVSFAKLRRGAHDDSGVPKTGPMDRILSSHYQVGQGVDFSTACGLNGASNPRVCVPEYLGRLQPYAIDIPAGRAAGGYGMTLLLHSLSANYNQYSSSRNQSQFANRRLPSIVITPEARGPDQFYYGLGGADVFEVWADVARHYRLNPAYTEISGYSMGGIGTFFLGEQFPDLFARAQPTVGDERTTGDEISLRNIPVLMWNNSGDELVNPAFYTSTANALATDGYRYQLEVYQPCESTMNPQKCSPAFPGHLTLAVNDQYAPAAAFLDSAKVDRNPAHVSYAVDTSRDARKYGMVADHAYWASGLRVRSAGSLGTFDARSHGFGVGDPTPSGEKPGAGLLTGGYLGPLAFTSFTQTWGATPRSPRSDTIDINAMNIRLASIDVRRAHVDCAVTLKITTDGPLTVTLPGCRRRVQAG